MQKTDFQGIGRFHRVSKRLCITIEQELDQRLKKYDLTASQGYLFLYIYKLRHSDVYITNLQKDLGYSKATLSGNVKKLRQKGYIRIESDLTDERKKKITLTRKAEMIAGEIETIIQNMEEEVYGALDFTERKMLFLMEDKMMQHILEQKGGEQNDKDSFEKCKRV